MIYRELDLACLERIEKEKKSSTAEKPLVEVGRNNTIL